MYRSLHRTVRLQKKTYIVLEGLDDLREAFRAPLRAKKSAIEEDEEAYSTAEKRLSFLRMETKGMKGYYRVMYEKQEDGTCLRRWRPVMLASNKANACRLSRPLSLVLARPSLIGLASFLIIIFQAP